MTKSAKYLPLIISLPLKKLVVTIEQTIINEIVKKATGIKPAEEELMQADTVWNLFMETGDIEYYLIYRAEETEGETERTEAAG